LYYGEEAIFTKVKQGRTSLQFGGQTARNAPEP